MAKAINADPRKKTYMDLALTPAVEEDLSSLDLFNQNEAARNAVHHERQTRAKRIAWTNRRSDQRVIRSEA